MAVFAVTLASGHLGGFAVYELGGSAFGLPELARVISEVAGTLVTYRDLVKSGVSLGHRTQLCLPMAMAPN